jgi:hypothetical protein
MIRRTMAQGLRELIGRAMVDQEFFVELQRAPESILSGYELNADERATVLAALDRLAKVPANKRVPTLRRALLRRVST